jgi:predicted phage tail protein
VLCRRFSIAIRAIEKREAIGPALQVTLDIIDEVFRSGKAKVLRAGEIAQNRALLSARDAGHLAVMERQAFDRFWASTRIATHGLRRVVDGISQVLAPQETRH